MRKPRTLVAVAAAALTFLTTGCVAGEDAGGATGGNPGDGRRLRLDYAYYNFASLVIRDRRWLEDELKDTKITWVLSAGSNKANENLRADAIDIGSTAGAAALLARANGTPIKTIAVFARPEWTALVVPAGSPIASLTDLKGKKVAATKGTDPYFFLLQSLQTAGLTGKDVQVVNLQHADGKTALERGSVDAWAGLDPYMAQTEQEAGSTLLYRNPGFNTYGVLNAREEFLAEHPDLAQTVLNAYGRAARWIREHPRETAELLAREAKIPLPVAKAELERTSFDVSAVPGADQRTVLERIAPILVADGDVKSEQAVRQALDSLFEPRFAQAQNPPQAS
ncbi:aliphatic sulfonate ABC transporter substrate-binding protein [Thermomonospora catenispora]|uniref:aliphatic sulfonate ABC transporter substrate-binding protein n=1 Tax=Thermomonospora catenispora TaxID=2493090 RepID=UPI00112237AF|nr:aliphatic sulfonate ABC transporter substrate-binding protein [Thermomonospora catenispora]TNY35937.1 aliphatic sulfonate ABC transporter substrate-binding protein [Thermomonospora catenispora]